MTWIFGIPDSLVNFLNLPGTGLLRKTGESTWALNPFSNDPQNTVAKADTILSQAAVEALIAESDAIAIEDIPGLGGTLGILQASLNAMVVATDPLDGATLEGSYYLNRANHTGQLPALYKTESVAIQAIASTTALTGINMFGPDTQVQINNAGFSAAADLIALSPGVWMVGGRVAWSSVTTGNRYLEVRAMAGACYPTRHGSCQNSGDFPSGRNDQSVSTVVYVPVSASVGLACYQNSGASLNITETEAWAYQLW